MTVQAADVANMNRRAALTSLLKALSVLPLTESLFAEEPPPPGKPTSARSKTLETGAALLQSKSPLNAIHAHVCGFHFYNGEPGRQVIAHHYCSHLSDEMLQCVIYDSDKSDARLIGIEYIISKRLFDGLPGEEKKLWHSHAYEVKSGQLFAPALPDVAEKELMKDLVGTYGKTFHTWQIDRARGLGLGRSPHSRWTWGRTHAVGLSQIHRRGRSAEAVAAPSRRRALHGKVRDARDGATTGQEFRLHRSGCVMQLHKYG